MMIAGRFFAGLGCGMILSIVPVYIAEVSPPKQRGVIVGLQGMLIAIGFFSANCTFCSLTISRDVNSPLQEAMANTGAF
jgi:MFS family permease